MSQNNSIWKLATNFSMESGAFSMESEAPEPVTVTEPDVARQHPKAVTGSMTPVEYQVVASSPLVLLLNRLVPQGYGTYLVVLLWLMVNIASAFGYVVPGFEVATGNEGALGMAGLALAYLRRAIGTGRT